MGGAGDKAANLMTAFCLFSLLPKAWQDLACPQILASPLPDSGLSSACGYHARPLQLAFWEMLSSLQPELDDPGWAATPSGFLTWGLEGGISAYRALGKSGAIPPK